MANKKIIGDLPPNVTGRCCGNLQLLIDEIKWKTKTFNIVNITIIWWGQQLKTSQSIW